MAIGNEPHNLHIPSSSAIKQMGAFVGKKTEKKFFFFLDQVTLLVWKHAFVRGDGRTPSCQASSRLTTDNGITFLNGQNK